MLLLINNKSCKTNYLYIITLGDLYYLYIMKVLMLLFEIIKVVKQLFIYKLVS